MEASLGNRVIVGAIVRLLGGVPIHIITVLTTVVCFRTLAPADYGAYSLALAIYGFSDIFTNPSVSTFLIREKNCSDHTIDVAFSISALRGALLTPLFWLVSPFLARAFDGGPEVEQMLRIMCLGFLFMGLKNLHAVRFDQELRMGRVLLVDSLGTFLGALLGIVLLLIWKSPLALVIGAVSRNVINTASSWAFSPVRPKWTWDQTELKRLWNFTRFLLANALIIYALNNLDDLMVAKLAGVASLGLYSISYGIVNSALMFLIKPLHQIILPALAKLQHDRKKLTSAMVTVSSTYSFISWMICSTLWFAAEDLFEVLGHSEEWLEGAPVFRALLPFVLIRGINGSMGQFMLVMGRPHLITMISGSQLVLMIPLGLVGLSLFGFLGLVSAITLANGLAMAALVTFSLRFIDARPWTLILTILLPLPAAVLGAFASRFIQGFVSLPAVRLPLGIIVGLLVFSVCWELICRLPLGPLGRQSVGGLLARVAERRYQRRASKAQGANHV